MLVKRAGKKWVHSLHTLRIESPGQYRNTSGFFFFNVSVHFDFTILEDSGKMESYFFPFLLRKTGFSLGQRGKLRHPEGLPQRERSS